MMKLQSIVFVYVIKYPQRKENYDTSVLKISRMKMQISITEEE
jgi:hypothetical protein